MERSADKYTTLLPDIDTSGPDVYETEDVEGEATNQVGDCLRLLALTSQDDGDSDGEYQTQTKTDTSQDIHTDRLDAAKARAKFKGSRLADPDFSNKLFARKTSQKYPQLLPDARTYEYLPRGYSTSRNGIQPIDAVENPTARLRRLRMEIDELETDLERQTPTESTENSENASPAVIMSQLKSLRSDLTRISTPNIAATQKPQTPSSLPVESTTRTNVTSSTSNLISLSAQVDTIEALVGPASSLTAIGNGTPLTTMLSKIESQLNLLTQPRHLDTLNRRIKVLVSDLDRIHETRRKLGDTTPLNVALPTGLVLNVPGSGSGEVSGAFSTPKLNATPHARPTGTEEDEESIPKHLLPRLDEMLALLPRLNALMPIVPTLLLRLRTLSDLHTSAADFDATLNETQSQVQSMSESAAALQPILQKLEESLKTNQEMVQSNLANFEQRLAQVISAKST